MKGRSESSIDRTPVAISHVYQEVGAVRIHSIFHSWIFILMHTGIPSGRTTVRIRHSANRRLKVVSIMVGRSNHASVQETGRPLVAGPFIDQPCSRNRSIDRAISRSHCLLVQGTATSYRSDRSIRQSVARDIKRSVGLP